MSTTLTQTLPIPPLATIRPGIAPARAERLEKDRERLAQKPCAFDVLMDARVARSTYQRDLLRQFMQFLVSFPRKVLARGGRFEVLEGQTHYDRFVILEYPSFDAALAYFHSPEYQGAAELRRAGGNSSEVVVLDGVPEGYRES